LTEESRLGTRPIYSLICYITSISWTLKGNLLSSTDKSSIHRLEDTQALELAQLDINLMEVVVLVDTHNHQTVVDPKHTLLIKMLILVLVRLQPLTLDPPLETLGDPKKKEVPSTLQTTITLTITTVQTLLPSPVRAQFQFLTMINKLRVPSPP
jgi:hypothetical protein